MGKFHPEITPELREFIAEQQMFFTATAMGRINLSPKASTLSAFSTKKRSHISI